MATANNGHWFFTGWNDGNTNLSRTIAVPLTNITYTATFTQYVGALVFYVATNGNDSADGHSWGTAKQTVQGGVDATLAGDTVIVSNGVFATGTRVTPGYSTSNRVVITNSIVVQSVNGASFSSIVGASNGDTLASVRCVYMTAGTLAGFTLTGGRAPKVSANAQDNSGGGAFATGGTLSQCTLSGNSAANYGGGAYGGTLNNSLLSGNSASGVGGTGGGGACVATLNNCALTGNSSLNGGGSLFSTLNNCTLSGNSANNGGGSYADTLNNCIVYFNTDASGFPNYNGSTVNSSCTTPLPSGAGNIANNPLFVATNNFHLSASSPCINAGNNGYSQGATDLDGNPRIFSGAVDMGAYEYQALVGYWAWAAAITNSNTNLNQSASGDGYPNLLKYATGSSATSTDSLARVNGSFTTNSNIFALRFNRNTNATDVSLFIERASTLTNGTAWTGIATNIGGAGWNSTNVTETGSGSPVTVTVQDSVVPATNRFLRLRVTRP